MSPVAEAQQWRIERSVATRQWDTEKKISPYRKSQLMRCTRTRYPWDKVVSHKFPLEAINEAFAQQNKGHVTRAAIVPN